MESIWDEFSVAAQQIIALCTEELLVKLHEHRSHETYFSMEDKGYPLSRSICNFLDYFDTIDDGTIISLVDAYYEAQKLISLLASGEIEILEKKEMLDILNRKYGGRLSIFAPLNDLSWVLLCHYENIDMGGVVNFRFVDAITDRFDRSIGLERLLQIARNKGLGDPDIPHHNL